jgi:hypothetical protein
MGIWLGYIARLYGVCLRFVIECNRLWSSGLDIYMSGGLGVEVKKDVKGG